MEANKIIITGGATRIGSAIAKSLSGPGVEIVIHFNKSKIDAEKLKKDLIIKQTKVYLVKGDLSKETDVIRICILYNSDSGADMQSVYISRRGIIIKT